MKKCASCTKDLPDAALHCVFCGAKQPPAPATPPAAAKTVMGYSGPELDQLRAQAAAQNAQRSGTPSSSPATIPAANAPMPSPVLPALPPPVQFAPRPAAPSSPPPMSSSQPTMMPPTSPMAPYGGSNPALAPAASAAAPTMFEQPSPYAANKPAGPSPSGPAAAGAFNVPPPGMQTIANAEANRLPMPSAQPAPVPVSAPAPASTPAASPPYLASQTAGRAAKPVDPYGGALRKWLFVWGGLLILAFVLPLHIDPTVFNWDLIINGEGAQKLPPLIMAAVGFLAIVMALMPLGTSPRGAITLLLGLTGIFVPTLINGMPPWQMLVATVGMVLVPMGLLARHEYRDAMLPKIMITVGALMYLTLWLVPVGDTIPLIGLFGAVAEAPGALKLIVILFLLQVLLVVLALLCWLPAPASAGARPIAWILMLYPLVFFALALFAMGDPGAIADAPGMALAWVWGGAGAAGGKGGGEMAMFAGLSMGVAYHVLSSYGGASVIGKSLE